MHIVFNLIKLKNIFLLFSFILVFATLHMQFLVRFCVKLYVICVIISFQHGGSIVSCMTFFALFNPHSICFQLTLSCGEWWKVGFFEWNLTHFCGGVITRRPIPLANGVCPFIFFYFGPYGLAWLLLCSFPINVRSEIGFVFFNEFGCPWFHHRRFCVLLLLLCDERKID